MLRSILIALSKAKWAQRLVTHWKLAWRVASRFIAGDTIDDAVRVIETLNQQGCLATLDHLGENTASPEDADEAVLEIIGALDAIDRHQLHSNVSLKLSQLGIVLDPELAYRNLLRVLEHARKLNNYITVDMEDSSLTQITLELVFRARAAGFENVGTVIQSYLYRSLEDTQRLADGNVPVRMVKGAYLEPPELVFARKQDVDASFDRLTEILIDAQLKPEAPQYDPWGRFPPLPAVASHDQKRIENARAYAQARGLDNRVLEFQLLYGIRRDLQQALVSQGYPMRIYVPYGTHWYPYFMRRLAERPANVWFFLSNFFHR
jgi:proline dehydrogenase